MRDDPIALLARANPIPGPVTPAPIAEVLARIDLDAPGRSHDTASGRRPRLLGLLMPTIAVGVTLALAAAAILLIHSPGRTAPAASSPDPHVPAATAHGGMRGVVRLTGVAFSSQSDGVVTLQQCLPACFGAKKRVRDWLATTDDAGDHWQVKPVTYSILAPVFTGADGWASGTSSSNEALYYVTHDGGRSWIPARLTGGQSPYTTAPAVADGTAWAIGNRCVRGAACTYSVMRGNASQSTLSPTAGQPAPHAQTMSITAGSADTAYATAFGARSSTTYATHDAGDTWSTVSSPCRSGLYVATGQAVIWEACLHGRVAVSDDGGHHWQLHPSPRRRLNWLGPVSASTAWAVTFHDALVRTTDGGRTWHAVVFPPTNVGPPTDVAPLNVLSATSVALAFDYDNHRRTQVMVDRVSGPINSSSTIKLPPGLR